MWRPKCKQDVVDLLIQVQMGYASCGFAADVLFPEFARNTSCNERYKRLKENEVSNC